MGNFIVIINHIISNIAHPVSDCVVLIADCMSDKFDFQGPKSEIQSNGLFAAYCMLVTIVY
jgi:hypothetical protein